MYELKTLLPGFDVTLPKCMYQMKNLGLQQNAPSSDATSTTSCDVSDKDKDDSTSILRTIEQQIDIVLKTEKTKQMADLEQRQGDVIKQLHELKDKLTGLRSTLNVCGKTLQHTQLRQDSLNDAPLPDIVINAHPKYIPYALLALKNIWRDVFNIEVKVHSHSTICSLDKDAIEFQNKITIANPNTHLPGIKVRLIWKNTEHTEMISSPTMYVPIYGEVNIIRYLARVGPKNYRYEETDESNDVDVVLDICYQLLRCQTAKTRQPLLRSLNDRLKNQTYFIGKQLSIADIAVSSSIRRTSVAAKEITDNMNKWLVRVEQCLL